MVFLNISASFICTLVVAVGGGADEARLWPRGSGGVSDIGTGN